MQSTAIPAFNHPSFRGRIGVAQCDITPPVGIYSRTWGAATHEVAQSIHRPLTLSAMTIASSQRSSPLVLVCADLSFWKTPEAMATFQAQLLQELALPPEDFIFALAHTHAAPPLVITDEPLPGGDLLREYMESLPERIVETVRQAEQQSFDAILEWETGRCSLATIRDFRDPAPGKDRFLCGYSPAAKADDTLLVGRISDPHGTTRATLVNYACHPTTLAWENRAISPDYIGATRELVEQTTQAPMFFLLGACGELAPRYQYTGVTTVADAHGRQLGYAVLSTLSGMEPPGTALKYAGIVESGAPLACWSREPHAPSSRLDTLQTTIDIPLKHWPTAEELEREYLASSDPFQQERLRRKRGIRLALGDGDTFPLKLFTWRIGEAILTGSLGEAYSVFQEDLRAQFKENPVICMNLINGSLGYLPPADRYDEDIYPVWQTPFDRGCLELTLAAARKSIHDLLSR
ncbi:MAG: alkaline ceramidase [Pirellulaceae bacterium]